MSVLSLNQNTIVFCFVFAEKKIKSEYDHSHLFGKFFNVCGSGKVKMRNILNTV